MTRAAMAARRLRRPFLAHRRALAALCLGLAVALALQSQAAPSPRTVDVLVAARDLAGGTPLRRSDVTEVPFAPGSVPQGRLASAADAVGRTTVGPVRAGEPLTDVRVLGDDILEHYPGLVAAPVRIGDADALDLLQEGDRVDILAADPETRGTATRVAARVPVLAIPPARRSDPGLVSGGLLVVAVPESTARQLAGMGLSSLLSVVLVR